MNTVWKQTFRQDNLIQIITYNLIEVKFLSVIHYLHMLSI